MKKAVFLLSISAVLAISCAPQPAGDGADVADTVYTNGKI